MGSMMGLVYVCLGTGDTGGALTSFDRDLAPDSSWEFGNNEKGIFLGSFQLLLVEMVHAAEERSVTNRGNIPFFLRKR
jgi:hypothetical protein